MSVRKYPRVIDEYATVQRLVRGYSIARFGDGELKMATGSGYAREVPNKRMAAELMEILHRPHPNCLVGIWNYNPEGPKFGNMLRHLRRFKSVLSPDVHYCSSFISRPDSAPWIRKRSYAEQVQRIWAGKKVAVVCERKGSIARTVQMSAKITHIECPHAGAYAHIDKLEAKVLASGADLAVLSVGPTATCLAHRLAGKGMQAIDFGSGGKVYSGAAYVISIVCWQWIGHDHRRKFDLEEVNRLQRGFKKYLSMPHRFICISDSATGLSKEVEWLRTPAAANKWASLQSIEGVRFPACSRRLWTFSKEAGILGERLFLTDIDAVPVDQLDPLMEYEEDFVGWRPCRDWGSKRRFGGGNFLLRAGTRTKVWDEFNGVKSAQLARKAGYRGSDQAWMSYMLAETEKCWPQDCGIYSVRDMGPTLELPKGARLIHFNGVKKPWQYARQSHGPGAWVSRYWQ